MIKTFFLFVLFTLGVAGSIFCSVIAPRDLIFKLVKWTILIAISAIITTVMLAFITYIF